MTCFLTLVFQLGLAQVGELDAQVLTAENDRIAVIEKVKPSVVAIFARGGQGGGSGVLIDPEGYALTNFHVVEGLGPTMQCGLPDGILYDAVLVGLDKVGDVALIKLLPKEKDKPFPTATLGDSDTVRSGDWALAMGNPFLLATDFTPTVTFGLVSGTNRYQYPAGSLLEYTDCIQIDASINPGNSGGPLFNLRGELIGINGRGSFEKRGRVNSGVGYAISINQIKNFLGQLSAGIDTDHATLGAQVETANDELAVLSVTEILDEYDARRRGLNVGDELLSFAGRPLGSVNQYKNVLGIYPKGWRLPLVYRRKADRREVLVRLMGVLPTNLDEREQAEKRKPKPGAKPEDKAPPSPAAKFFKAKKGFANYYFNEQAQEKLLAAHRKHGDFSGLTGEWSFTGDVAMAKDRGQKSRPFTLKLTERKATDGSEVPVVELNQDGLNFQLEPLKSDQEANELQGPPGSGGLMLAFYHLKRFLARDSKAFEGGFDHGGREPFYPPPASGPVPARGLSELRVDAEVLRTEHAAVPARWYFSTKDQSLLGFEVYPVKDDDPCEVYLSDYKTVNGRQVPHRIEVRRGYEPYAVYTITSVKLPTK